MSINDIWVRDTISQYGMLAVTTMLVIIWIKEKWPKFQQYVYKTHLLGFETECAELATPYKAELFKILEQRKSHDTILRSMRRIRILEIRVKTGENIPFYPNGTHLIGVDWNRKLGEYLINGNRFEEFAHIILESLIIGDGSSLKGIPDCYVDAVVSTRSLCSVASVSNTLREIRRVLTPVQDFIH